MRAIIIALSCAIVLACSSPDRESGTAADDGAADSTDASVIADTADSDGTADGDSGSSMDSLTTTATVSLDEEETFPADITSRTVPFTCDDGQKLSATYLSADSGAVSLVILRWDGKAYGLAQAVSASGARYASLYGPTPEDRGMEWWEAKGEARLGVFTDTERGETRPLFAGCRPGA